MPINFKIIRKSSFYDVFILFCHNSAQKLIKIDFNISLNKKPKLFYFPIWILKLAGFILKKSNQIDKLIDSLEIDTKFSYKTLDWKPPFSSDLAFRKTIDWYLEKNKMSGR